MIVFVVAAAPLLLIFGLFAWVILGGPSLRRR